MCIYLYICTYLYIYVYKSRACIGHHTNRVVPMHKMPFLYRSCVTNSISPLYHELCIILRMIAWALDIMMLVQIYV